MKERKKERAPLTRGAKRKRPSPHFRNSQAAVNSNLPSCSKLIRARPSKSLSLLFLSYLFEISNFERKKKSKRTFFEIERFLK